MHKKNLQHKSPPNKPTKNTHNNDFMQMIWKLTLRGNSKRERFCSGGTKLKC